MSKVFTSEIGRYIKSDDLDGLISKLHKGTYVSKGRFSATIRGIVEDFEWNHIDQTHRLYLHDAYHDALRIATSKDIAISLTTWKNLPVYIQVADMRIDRGLFYQNYTILGLLFCHQTCRMIQQGENVLLDIQWSTVSHRFLWFVHGMFNKMMYKLIKKQSDEDYPVRMRRDELRAQGFRFKTDEPDYFNSNVLSDMIIFPETDLPKKFKISGLELNKRQKIQIGPTDFYVVRGESEVQVWPATCTHEGAVLPESKFCDGAVACPWHNRKFKAVTLQNGKGRYLLGNLVLTLEGDELVLRVSTTKQASESIGRDAVSNEKLL